MKKQSFQQYGTYFSLFLFLLLFSFSARAVTVLEVEGKALPSLLGQPVSSLRLYASSDGATLRAIPFQIDQKNANGVWLLDSDGAGTGNLAPQDVLLFHMDDVGVALKADKLPAGKSKAEITTSGKFVYLIAEENPAPKSTKSYVKVDSAQDRVATGFYDIGFNQRSALVQDELILRNGSRPVDILDRFKVRFNLAIKNFFDFKINESDVEAKIAGYRVGPIRVIRRVVATKKLGPINVIPKSSTDFMFYPNWVEVPTRVNNPIDGPKFLEEKTQGLSGYDFSRAVYGSSIYSSLGESPMVLDGVLSPAEENLSQGVATWWALSGPVGSLVVGIQNDPKLMQLGLEPSLRIIDETGRSDPPEGESGSSFIGFLLPYNKMPKGSYLLVVRQVFPWRFQHGQEKAYLQEAKTVKIESSKTL